MKNSAVVVALVALAALGGCGKKPKPLPPPPPPAAPATPPPAPPSPTTRDVAPVESEYDRLIKLDSPALDRMGLLADVYFDLDKHDLREGDRQILAKNAETLRKFDFIKVTVEGHCDERGTAEYNLALGERRARAAFDYLVSLGVPADRLKTVSYGKEVPVCQQSSEDCWSRNRRAHFSITGKVAR